jgi:uncharacterized protein YjaZ
MNKDLSQIEFYFPSGKFKDKNEIVDSVISLMREMESIDYSGHTDVESLRLGIMEHIGDTDVDTYTQISKEQKLEIEKVISETIEKCNEELSIPTKNYIFVFPYLPLEKDVVFGGVNGVARYSCVFHIFLSLKSWSQESLAHTVAHELNHTIYYYHHYDDFNNYTLLDEMIMEGLAENFREQLLGGSPAPWAIALAKQDVLDTLSAMNEETLYTRDQNIIKSVLFGNNKYQKWTGYSIGYWLVKEFIKNNPNLSWNEIMKLPSRKVLQATDKKKT